MGDAFGQSPRVDKHQGGAMRLDQLGETIIDVRPNGIGRDRAKFIPRCFNSQIHFPALSHVDKTTRGWRPGGFSALGNVTGAACQEPDNGLQRFLRGRKPNAIRFRVRDGIQSLQGKRHVRPAFVAGQGVDFIDDNRADGAKNVPALASRQ